MTTMATSTLDRNPDELSLREREELRGYWIALRIYSPENLALRRIAAIGESAAACRNQLREAGEALAAFEYRVLR
jgi:hypothetical protein